VLRVVVAVVVISLRVVVARLRLAPQTLTRS
jgi:hypothetical protein